MRTSVLRVIRHSGKRSSRTEQGVALVITLLLLMLLTALTLAMVLSASSDTLINGYYQNFRSSFYAADSGLNIARQQMITQLAATVPTTFNPLTSPIPAGTEATVQANILSALGGNQKLNQGQASASWPQSYHIKSVTLTLVTSCSPSPCVAPPYTQVIKDGAGNITGYQYIYNYTLNAVGQGSSNEETEVSDSGNLIINASLSPGSPTPTSFAAWGMFVDQYNVCSGSYLVPGTVSGPVFTNGGWTFSRNAGTYIFTDPVGSAASDVGYYKGNNCSSLTSPSSMTNVSFQAGLQLGSTAVSLPQNDYSQEQAVLDGMGVCPSPPCSRVSKSAKAGALRDANGAAYPNSGASTGVFMPFSTDPAVCGMGVTPPCVTGGGIYVEGNASVTLTASGVSAQVYTIKQGTTTTTVTVNLATNTTTFSNGASTQVLSGVPAQLDPTTGGVVRDATMLYVNGSITGLTGPHDASTGASLPALNDGQAVTVTAAGDVTVTGDLIYKTQPVTKTQDPKTGAPADSLIPGADNGQVLGIFTAGGNIQMNNLQSGNPNLEIDASLAALSAAGVTQSTIGSLVNVGSQINTLTIVGGRIQNRLNNINSITRNIFFDRRFTQGNFAPPWFPSTVVAGTGTVTATVNSSVQRRQWVDHSSI